MAQLNKTVRANPIALAIGDAYARELNDLDNGPAVFRFIAENLDLTRKIAEMPTEKKIVHELYKISAQLDGRNNRIESRAPDPIKPVSAGTARYAVPLDQIEDQQKYKRARREGRTR